MTTILSELIHQTAVISAEADIADDVQIGPYAVVEGPVTIGPGCIIESHASLCGMTVLGRNNVIGHGAVLGKGPQHRGCQGDGTSLIIGDDNVIREHVTIHRGTVAGGGLTRLGNQNYLMIGSHVGHDSQVGNGCTLVNGALVAGHVRLDDGCILSGHSAIQQRVRVGRLAMIGGLGSSTKDIPPFVLAQGYNTVTNLNVVGLRRAGFGASAISGLREAFRTLYKEGRSQGSALDRILADLGGIPEVVEFVSFIRESTVGIATMRGQNRDRRSSE